MTLRSAWLASMPGLFVVLWSSGYVFGKLGLPYAGPATFLFLRFCIVVALMLPISLITRSDWPRSWRALGHIVAAGLMVQAFISAASSLPSISACRRAWPRSSSAFSPC